MMEPRPSPSSSTRTPSPSTGSVSSPLSSSLSRSSSSSSSSASLPVLFQTTTSGSGRTIGLGPSHPSTPSPSTQPHPTIGSTSFPLLPRLEDAVDPPAPTEDVHSLTAILNDPTQPSDSFAPLPLTIPPLPWSDRELGLSSLTSQLSSLSLSLSRFHCHHPDISPLGLPRPPSPATPDTDSRRAAEQLRHCLAVVPERFFAAAFDDIEEAFSFTRTAAEEAGEADDREGGGARGGGGEGGGAGGEAAEAEVGLHLEGEEEKVESAEANGGSHPSQPTVLPTSPPVTRGVSQYDPKTQMYSRLPPLPSPAKAPPLPAKEALVASPAPSTPSTGRSFLSYIAAALGGASAPTFTVPPLPLPSSSFLSSRRFASLSLSPAEERRAAQLLSSLSSYLDTLELTLTSQIQLRSASFFSSLLTINSLHADVSAVITQIDSIRAQLRLTSHRLTHTALSTLCTVQRRSRLLLTLAHVEEMALAARRAQRCRSLLEQGRWMAVLAVMHTTRVQLMGDRLKGVKAAEGMIRDLRRMLEEVDKGLRKEMAEVLVDGVQEERGGESGSEGGGCAGRELREEEQEVVFELSQCLYHVHGLLPFIDHYREELLRTMKERTRQHLDALIVAAATPSHPSQPPSPALSLASSAHGHASPGELPTSSPRSTFSSPSTSTSASPVSTPHPPAPPRERSFQQALSAILPTARPATAAASSPPTSSRALPALSSEAGTAVTPVAHPAGPLPPDLSPSPLARYLSSLSPSAYLEVLCSLFELWLDPLGRVVSVRAVVVQAVASIPAQLFLNHARLSPNFLCDTPPPTLDVDTAAAAAAMSSLLLTAADWAHAECNRIVGLRPPEPHLPALASLISHLSTFISHTARLTGDRPSPLRAAMTAQASSYLSSFHALQSAALMEKLNKEQWSRVDVPREFQSMIDSRYERRVAAAVEQTQPSPAPSAASTPAGGAHAAPDGSAVKAESIVGARVFFVEGTTGAVGASVFDKFPIVPAVLCLLQAVSAYLDLASQLPSAALDISERLLQLLSAFNSKVHALILGAGALKSAGLKTITTTHLALCAQCIGFVLTQLPAIAVRLATPTPASSSTSLSALEAEFALHQRQLLLKLESIMNDLAEAAFRKLVPALRAEPPTPASASAPATAAEAEPDPTLKTLMTQTRSLNSSLSHILSQEQRRELFTHLCTSYCALLSGGVQKLLDLSRETVRERAAAAASWMLKQFYLLPGQDLQACKDLAQLLHVSDLQPHTTQDSTEGRPNQSQDNGGSSSAVAAAVTSAAPSPPPPPSASVAPDSASRSLSSESALAMRALSAPAVAPAAKPSGHSHLTAPAPAPLSLPSSTADPSTTVEDEDGI